MARSSHLLKNKDTEDKNPAFGSKKGKDAVGRSGPSRIFPRFSNPPSPGLCLFMLLSCGKKRLRGTEMGSLTALYL
jgi:hypothetical protein